MRGDSRKTPCPLALRQPTKVSPRLSLAECRRLLGADSVLSDSEVEAVRDTLYALAHVVVDALDSARRDAAAGVRHIAKLTIHTRCHRPVVAASGDTPVGNL